MAKGTSSRRHEKVATPGILYAVQITEPVDIFWNDDNWWACWIHHHTNKLVF